MDNNSSPSSDREQAQREADEHFANARKAGVAALGHSIGAGAAAAAGIPPAAVVEGYQAVEAWKEMAQEYNAGCEAQKRAEE
ncbi:MAG TPA: hypothetical protein PKW79_04585 [Rhabdochlamydiaceae bacterium]|nr:hypothetical protein [Rhabdochlamydiaceae bacterium]